MQDLRAFLREPGRYIVNPSLEVSTDKVVDTKTGTESAMNNAWTGSLIAEPFAIDLPVSVDEPSGHGVIEGTVVSADGRITKDAVVELHYSKRGRTELRDNDDSDLIQGRVLDQVLSDKSGRFDFVGVPDDADFRLIAVHHEHGRKSIPFTFKEFTRRDQPIIKFPRRITIRGKVLDKQGSPVSQVHVSHYPTVGSYTGDDGTFQCIAIENSDGEPYRIELSKKGWLTTREIADRQLATSGELIITMPTEAEMSVRGRAIFVDGTPLSKMTIRIALSPIEDQVDNNQFPKKEVQTDTDLDGNFRFVMPSKDDFSGIAIATAKSSDVKGERRWMVEIPNLSLGEEHLELKFENRGQIVLAVFGTGNLPDSLKPTISLRSPSHNYNLEGEQTSVIALGKVREYEGLEPGEYVIDVSIENSGIKSQSVKVTVPNGDPFLGVAKIQLSKTVFGSMQAKILMPDNRTPASQLALEINSSDYNSHSLKTDDSGGFQLEYLPIGNYGIRVKASDEISPNSVPFDIVDENLHDLGVIHLKAVEEEFGWFDGKITYEGGESLGGVFVVKTHENDFTASDVSEGAIPDPNLKPSGVFHLRLPVGNNDLIFHLHGNGPSPMYMGSSYRVSREIRHKLIVNVDVEAGKTVKRDFFVPPRKDCRDINVGWVGLNELRFSIISPWKERTRWIYSASNSTYKLDSTGKRIKQGNFTFSGFPTGAAYVLVDSSEFAEKVFAIKPIPNLNDDSVIVFNQQDLSSIKIGLVDEKGAQLNDFTMYIHAVLNEETFLVAGLIAPSQSDQIRVFAPWPKRLDDGQVQIPNLGSGKYLVTVSNAIWEKPMRWRTAGLPVVKDPKQPSWEHTYEVDLADRKNLNLRFQIDNEGQLVDTQVSASDTSRE